MIQQTQNRASSGVALIHEMLDAQQRLTAVERFSQQHDQQSYPAGSWYQDLIPLEQPKEGEQYAFEVNLDACTGCKSCVAACHEMNGLDEHETWRSVGLLHGGTEELPVLQHVTTSCHHCVEPACMHGCPVNAYEKDDVTGIVQHLDDQCIGCQYCTLSCPYDVPKYHPEKGIVRKCDMCSDRLSAGEAPACVQSCPNGAIRIKTVSIDQVLSESEVNSFVPGAAEPHLTLPTTNYKTKRSMPRNLLPANYYSASREHSHPALVVMLVLTQMSVGAFVVNLIVKALLGQGWPTDVQAVYSINALLLGLIGMGASVFHLGRPFYGFRAFIGLKKSWLSREILCFSLFAFFATGQCAATAAGWLGIQVDDRLQTLLTVAAAFAGVAGVFCSIMIYVVTGRDLWSPPSTLVRFVGTMTVLGFPAALLLSAIAAVVSDGLAFEKIVELLARPLLIGLIIANAVKLLSESSVFLHLWQRRVSPLKRAAILMTGDLSKATKTRYAFSLAGGFLLPCLLLANLSPAVDFYFFTVVLMLCCVLLLLGELAERYLFFTASVAPKMPGGLG